MRSSSRWIVAAGVVLAVAASLGAMPGASAADRTFTLYGDQNQGWRLPGGSFANPGPALVVDEGDNVTLVLNATDGVNHNWFIDYDNDTGDDAAEPNSPVFRDEQIPWNFTADRNGTFAYRDKFHPDTMMGWITVLEATSPPTNPGDTPWIHRVILYLEWNITSNGYDVPSLLGLPRADWAARDAGGSDLEFPYAITGSVYLKHLGFRGDLGITFNLGELITQGYRQDGYITMGDYNSDRDCSAVRDPCPARPYDRWVVPHANVIGKARGELPSFGLIKLLVAPTPSCCRSWGDPSAPKNSWDALAVSIVLLIAAPFLIDYGWTFGTKRWKSWRARREEEPAEVGDDVGIEDEPEEPPPPDEYEGPI